MTSIRKIAVATDFEAPSELAVREAVNIARLVGAELVVVHAHGVTAAESSIARTARMRSDAIEAASRKEIEDDRKRLEGVREQIAGQGVTASAELLPAPAAEAVAEAAQRLGVDLVIVGTAGRTGLSRLFLGSVAEEIAEQWKGNILIARSDTGGFRRLVVATDFTPLATRAIDLARLLAAPGARIEVVHCVEEATGETLAQGEEAAARIRGDEVEVSVCELEGSAAQAIASHARDGGADLVALGSNDRRKVEGVEGALFGNIAERVLRLATCSVLIVRDPG